MTKEEYRKLDIEERLHELRLLLPYIERGYETADQTRKKMLDEIRALENEKFELAQGQLVFDDSF